MKLVLPGDQTTLNNYREIPFFDPFYLGGSYRENRTQLQDYKQYFESLGAVVTSNWLVQDHGKPFGMTEETPDLIPLRQAWAREDLSDVDKARTCIFFTERGGESTKGGMSFEHGYAYAMGKRLIIVGPKTNIFHYRACHAWFPDWDAFATAIQESMNGATVR